MEADHGVVIALLGFGRGSDGRSAVDGFMKDGVVRVGVFHGTEVVGTLEQVLTLTGGIFCTDGLAVDALRRETLCGLGKKGNGNKWNEYLIIIIVGRVWY